MDVLLYIFSMVLAGFLVGLLVYHIVLLSDLENDMINVRECSQRLNFWVVPICILNLLLTMMFVLTSKWKIVAMTVPADAFLLYQYINIPSGSVGLYDPTELLNGNRIKKHMITSTVLTGVYLLYLTAFFTCFIRSLSSGSPVTPHDPVEELKFQNTF